MPVNIQTTWAADTDIVVSSGPVYIKAVEVLRDPEATGTVYIQLYDATSATPSSTAITDMIAVPSAAATNDEGVHLKVNYSGKYYGTGLCIFCSTNRAGTQPSTVEVPEYVKVFYV